MNMRFKRNGTQSFTQRVDDDDGVVTGSGSGLRPGDLHGRVS